jgi:hypothetical protein
VIETKYFISIFDAKNEGGLRFLVSEHMEGPERSRFPLGRILEFPPVDARYSPGG